jgi:hypothetical protein
MLNYVEWTTIDPKTRPETGIGLREEERSQSGSAEAFRAEVHGAGGIHPL